MREKLVRSEMTILPITIEASDPVRKAEEMMRANEIRHLPVLKAGRLAGIVSQRAVRAALLSKWGEQMTCADIMLPDPETVSADASLNEAVEKILGHKIGSVLVIDGNREIVGIFTTIDALRVLRNAMVERPAPKDKRRTQRHSPSASPQSDAAATGPCQAAYPFWR